MLRVLLLLSCAAALAQAAGQGAVARARASGPRLTHQLDGRWRQTVLVMAGPQAGWAGLRQAFDVQSLLLDCPSSQVGAHEEHTSALRLARDGFARVKAAAAAAAAGRRPPLLPA